LDTHRSLRSGRPDRVFWDADAGFGPPRRCYRWMGVQIEAGIGYPDERVWQSPPNAGGCPAPSAARSGGCPML